ncbi:cysteine dioxygenase family protein [Paraburkholderia sprentiae WSM5005]|uniref:Cysteine dioxygenase family protein n=1 Tax=Paraburkholderia sprentiae WSM5005 TaxID=754502 RepID=A0A1I9YFS3_9BURK|nr:cysteine dioxygenase family protein [Paraburkholderia sprentiae]APA85156.1 cysteine dioxygenase family protein [Paraburkholderia sprentiae WSM5005]
MSDDLRATACAHLPHCLKPLSDPARLEAAALPMHTQGDIGRTPLERLCDTLDAIFEACATFPEPSHSTFFARSMRLALAEAAADPALLTPMQREGSAGSYRRHLLIADPRGRYAIAALVWQPGQASPVHAHHTWCGYAVVEGKLRETIFEWDDARQCASALRAQARKRGAVSFVRSGRGAIHRLGNGSDAQAVSLHIYGVEGARIGTHVNDTVRVADAAELVRRLHVTT